MKCRAARAVNLGALIAAIKRSPIYLRVCAHILTAAEWARIRKSPDVDKFILDWLKAEGEAGRRQRGLM
jgi:hypothetical protein